MCANMRCLRNARFRFRGHWPWEVICSSDPEISISSIMHPSNRVDSLGLVFEGTECLFSPEKSSLSGSELQDSVCWESDDLEALLESLSSQDAGHLSPLKAFARFFCCLPLPSFFGPLDCKRESKIQTPA